MEKKLIGITLCMSLSFVSLGTIGITIRHTIKDCARAYEASTDGESMLDEDENSIDLKEPIRTMFTYFDGTATDVDIGDNVFSTFYYPNQSKYFRFFCPTRSFLKLNYSGPNASLRIFYSNFFADTDYLVSTPYIASAPDCYYFDYDCEYIIELACYSIGSSTSFSFCLESLTTTNLINHKKYALHQTFDSLSNIGYHYQIEYFDVSETDYLATSSYVNSSSNSTLYADVIDDDHYFYDPNDYSFEDNRRVVVDTGFDEYNSIAYGSGISVYNSATYGFSNTLSGRFSGTFVSENAVVTAAHTVFALTYNQNGGIKNTGLRRQITFTPGINDYSSTNYYGVYTATDVYASISFVIEYSQNGGFSPSCSDYDWAICLTENTTPGTRAHSYMGISGFSYSENLTSWPYASFAGYPKLVSNPDDAFLYNKTMWTYSPLQNNVVIVDSRVEAQGVVTSKGNSGGAFYKKTSYVLFGYTYKIVTLLGIHSGSTITSSHSSIKSLYYRNTALIVNIFKTISSLTLDV